MFPAVSCNNTVLVEVKDPLKQGLKLTSHTEYTILKVFVEVKDPLKQGLKQNYNVSFQS